MKNKDVLIKHINLLLTCILKSNTVFCALILCTLISLAWRYRHCDVRECSLL